MYAKQQKQKWEIVNTCLMFKETGLYTCVYGRLLWTLVVYPVSGSGRLVASDVGRRKAGRFEGTRRSLESDANVSKTYFNMRSSVLFRF